MQNNSLDKEQPTILQPEGDDVNISDAGDNTGGNDGNGGDGGGQGGDTKVLD